MTASCCIYLSVCLPIFWIYILSLHGRFLALSGEINLILLPPWRGGGAQNCSPKATLWDWWLTQTWMWISTIQVQRFNPLTSMLHWFFMGIFPLLSWSLQLSLKIIWHETGCSLLLSPVTANSNFPTRKGWRSQRVRVRLP